MRFSAWMAAFFAALSFHATAGEPLVFLGDRDYAPFESLLDGGPQGINVDLARAIGRVLDRPVVVELGDWAQMQERFIAGHGHVLGMFAPTPEREGRFEFTQTTLKLPAALFVKEDPGGRLGARQYGDRRIGVTRGGFSRLHFEASFPEAQLVLVENLVDGTRRLLRGEIEALAAIEWTQMHLLNELGITGVRPIKAFAEAPVAMGLRKGDTALRSELDRALQQVKDSGELDRILDRWSSQRVRMMSDGELRLLRWAGAAVALVVMLLLFALLRIARERSRLEREIARHRETTRSLVESERALEEADRRKDDFLATLSHELRNPLAPIRTAAQIIKVAGGAQPGLQVAREMIDRQVGHMVRLIDDLLDVSRITRGKLELQREPVTLGAVLERALEAAQPNVAGQNHQLSVSLPDGPVRLDADPVRLAQVFTNLLNNACKYTDRGGRIELSAVMEGSDVVVKVSDNGIGIDPKNFSRLFEMFAQVESALARTQGGLGIGLALSKSLVEMHGGTITVESPGVGRGSTFTVRLPSGFH